MNKMLSLFAAALFMLPSCASYHSCHSFPKAFKTIEEAEIRLNAAECESLYDSASFSHGNLRHAAFYTCDKKMGYLILKWPNKKELYRNIPLQYWKNMRHSKSFESYFKQNVQFRFPLYLEARI